MKYDMDEMLRNALSFKKEPDNRLNQEIIRKVQEKERDNMGKETRKLRIPVAAMLAVSILLAVSVTGYAAWKYLTPGQVAEIVEDKGLAKAFQSEDAVEINEVQEYGNYRITLLGIVSGKNLSQYAAEDETGNIQDDRTYVVAAIENKDGTPRPDTSEDNYGEDPFFVSPLIQGLNPAMYNGVTMDGAYSEIVENGIQYRIAECNNVEMFADRQLYLCVSDGTFYNNDAYVYDEESGNISRNEEYQGVNALFSLPFDKSKADKVAAEAYIENFEKGWNQVEGSKEAESKDIPEEGDVAEADIIREAARESENWKLEDFEKNTELVKEMEIAPDKEGNYEYNYKIGADGLGSGGVLWKDSLSERDEGNMAKFRTVLGGDEQTAYIETYTIEEDGSLILRVYRYSK